MSLSSWQGNLKNKTIEKSKKKKKNQLKFLKIQFIYLGTAVHTHCTKNPVYTWARLCIPIVLQTQYTPGHGYACPLSQRLGDGRQEDKKIQGQPGHKCIMDSRPAWLYETFSKDPNQTRPNQMNENQYTWDIKKNTTWNTV